MFPVRWRAETKCIMLALTRIGFINWPQKHNFINIYCFSRHNTCFLYEKYQAVISAFVFHCSYDTNRYQIKCRADRLNPAIKTSHSCHFSSRLYISIYEQLNNDVKRRIYQVLFTLGTFYTTHCDTRKRHTRRSESFLLNLTNTVIKERFGA